MEIWTRRWTGALAASSLGLLAACSGEQRFQRVEQFPRGPQINYAASSFLTQVHTTHVSDRYTAPYAGVWAAAKRVVERLEKAWAKPTASVDEDMGVIVLTTDHREDEAKTMFNPDPLRIKGWRDEIRIKVIELYEDRTKVVVSRTVLGAPYDRRCPDRSLECAKPIIYEPEVSNGQIENWILTQIEDAIAKPP